MLNYLESIGINIDNYEHVYLSSLSPMNMGLTTCTVDLILSDNDYIEFCHLFNDTRIQQQMEERLLKNKVQHRMSFGRKQYYTALSSQMVQQDHVSITSSGTQDIDEQQHDDSVPLTFVQSMHRSIPNVSPHTGSSVSQNSSLFSEIHHLIINNPSVNNKLVDQLIAEGEPQNDFEHDNLSLFDDTLTQLCNIINPSLSDTSESTLTSNTTETIVHDPVFHHLNSYTEKNHEQQQQNSNQSAIENMESSSENNNNSDGTFPSTGTASYDMTAILQNINSQQTLELISELVRHKKHVVKRVFEQESYDSTSKRSKNNEDEDVTMPTVDFNMILSESLSSTSTEIQSNNSIGDDQINKPDYHSSIRKTNSTNSIPKSDTNFTSFSNTDIISTSISDTFPVTRNVDTLIESTDQEVNTNNESTNVNEQEQTTVDQQDVNERDLAEAYEKLILNNSIVMSKSEICVKLKHVAKISELRDNIISTLVNDKLLIEDNWFAIKRANGNVSLMSGYLKTFPKDDIQDQQDFARSLTKYDIHYHEFEQSFKRKKMILFHSIPLKKNSFLRERISIDPSAIIQESNVLSTLNKRHRKAQQRYSPSDNE